MSQVTVRVMFACRLGRRWCCSTGTSFPSNIGKTRDKNLRNSSSILVNQVQDNTVEDATEVRGQQELLIVVIPHADHLGHLRCKIEQRGLGYTKTPGRHHQQDQSFKQHRQQMSRCTPGRPPSLCLHSTICHCHLLSPTCLSHSSGT